jgi:hypothetical protein
MEEPFTGRGKALFLSIAFFTGFLKPVRASERMEKRNSEGCGRKQKAINIVGMATC